jgi:hypothetical protein
LYHAQQRIGVIDCVTQNCAISLSDVIGVHQAKADVGILLGLINAGTEATIPFQVSVLVQYNTYGEKTSLSFQ